MSRPEAGKWPAYNTKAIINNINLVFKKQSINKLNKSAYHFITLHMGFIAHYDVHGFRQAYEDLGQFAKALQTSEYSDGDSDYTLNQASRQETDQSFDQWYGAAYNKSIAETIRGIVAVARKYYPGSGGSAPTLDENDVDSGYAQPLTEAKPKSNPKPRADRDEGPANILGRIGWR